MANHGDLKRVEDLIPTITFKLPGSEERVKCLIELEQQKAVHSMVDGKPTVTLTTPFTVPALNNSKGSIEISYRKISSSSFSEFK